MRENRKHVARAQEDAPTEEQLKEAQRDLDAFDMLWLAAKIEDACPPKSSLDLRVDLWKRTVTERLREMFVMFPVFALELNRADQIVQRMESSTDTEQLLRKTIEVLGERKSREVTNTTELIRIMRKLRDLCQSHDIDETTKNLDIVIELMETTALRML